MAGVPSTAFSRLSMHAGRLWQFAVTRSDTTWSGTVGNFCFISWNSCIIAMFEQEHDDRRCFSRTDGLTWLNSAAMALDGLLLSTWSGGFLGGLVAIIGHPR